MRQYIKEVGKHSSIYIISNILTRAIGFILLPLLTSYLSSDEYGIVSIVIQTINFFTVLFSLGMRNAWGRFFFDYEDRSSEQKSFFGNLFSILLVFGLSASVLLSIFGKGLFYKIVPNIDFYPYILIGIWGAFFSVFIYLWIVAVGVQTFILPDDIPMHIPQNIIILLFMLYAILIVLILAGTFVATMIDNKFYRNFFGGFLILSFVTFLVAKGMFG